MPQRMEHLGYIRCHSSSSSKPINSPSNSIRYKTNGAVKTFGKSGKQDSFRHILKSSASMYESSGSQFFRTTTGIQSGPDVFDKSRLVMNLVVTNSRDTEILCSFRLMLEGKAGKEISESPKLKLVEKFSEDHFALSDAEDNTVGH